MRSIDALTMSSPDKLVRPQIVSLHVGKPQEIEKLAMAGGPLALIVRIADLDYFRAMLDVVTDAGEKEPRQGLSRYLLRKNFNRAPLLAAEFTTAGKALNSIRVLLGRAEQSGVAKLFIIGVPEPVLAKLFSQSKPIDKASASAATGMSGPFKENSPLTLMAPLKNEAALEKRFLGLSNQDMMVRRLIMYAAKSDVPVLILGETGTGKGLVAQLIHEMSSDGDQSPVMAVNCAGLPEHLIESELFGHVKGAFSGAFSDKVGMWEEAGGGVLFLDEIADMPLNQQVKILRALQDKVIRRVGENKERKVNARIVAATNRDLFAMMKDGRFRDDLYYRLRGFLIRTPPLRKNPDNIPFLARELWQEITDGMRSPLSAGVLQQLKGMGWPGNVRDLHLFLAGLHSHFSYGEISNNHVDALLKIQGIAGSAKVSKANEPKVEDIALHQAQCLSHLKVVEEELVALRLTLKNIIANDWPGAGPQEIKGKLNRNVAELAALCEPPKRIFFFDRQARDAVCGLSEKCFAFSRGLDREPNSALLSWASTAFSQVEKAESIVFDAISRLIQTI